MRIRRRGPSSLVTTSSSFPATHQDAAAPPLPTGPQDKEAMLQDLDPTKESRDSRPPVGGSRRETPCAFPPPPDSTSVQVMKDEEKEAMGMVAAMDFSKIAHFDDKCFVEKSATGARNKRKASCDTVEEKGNGKVEAMANVDSSCDVGGDAAASLFQEEKGSAENAESARCLGDPPVPMEKPRCNRTNGRGWRCRRDALLGYSLCECHIGKSRLLAIMAREKDPQATTKSMPEVSKTADAATSAVGGQEETGPLSQKPAVGGKRSKASTPRERLMSSIINEESHVPVPSPVAREPLSKSQAASVEASSPALALAPSSNNGVA